MYSAHRLSRIIQAVPFALAMLFVTNAETCADELMISRGTTVSVISGPLTANDEFANRSILQEVYLPAGQKFIRIDSPKLSGAEGRYLLILTQSGIWGLLRKYPQRYWNENWIISFNEARGWFFDCSTTTTKYATIVVVKRKTKALKRTSNAVTEIILYRGTAFKFIEERNNYFYATSFDPEKPECDTDRTIGDFIIEISSDAGQLVEFPSGFSLGAAQKPYTLETLRKEYSQWSRLPLNLNDRKKCHVPETREITEGREQELSVAINAALKLAYGEVSVSIEMSQKLYSEYKIFRDLSNKYEILREWYITANQRKIETITTLIECPDEEVSLTGLEIPVKQYRASETIPVTFTEEIFQSLGLERHDKTGEIVIKSISEYYNLWDHLAEYRLSNDSIQFAMSKLSRLRTFMADDE